MIMEVLRNEMEAAGHATCPFRQTWTISSSQRDAGRSCWCYVDFTTPISLCTFFQCTESLAQDCLISFET